MLKADAEGIDTNYKFYNDTLPGKDIDTYSKTLCQYHRLLWSKPLPDGTTFDLTTSKSAPYFLNHFSEKGDQRFTSDSIVHTFSRWQNPQMVQIIKSFAEDEITAFYDLATTIAGYIIFPCNIVDKKPTINGIRGMHPRIRDRFDLTLECIRLWYNRKKSPLFEHLERYRLFFELFGNFNGYIDFFLLNDYLTEKDEVRFFLPFKSFVTDPIPHSVEEYTDYKKTVIDIAIARKKQIEDFEKKRGVLFETRGRAEGT